MKMVTLQQIREKIQALEVVFGQWVNDKPGADIRQAAWDLIELVNTMEVEQNARQTTLAIDEFRAAFHEWLPTADDIDAPAGYQFAMVRKFKDVITLSKMDPIWPTLESPTHLRAMKVPEQQQMKIYGMKDRSELQQAIRDDEAGKWVAPENPNATRFWASINADFEKRELDDTVATTTGGGKRPPEAEETLEKLMQLGCSVDQILKMKYSLTREDVLREAEELGYKVDSSGMPRAILPKSKQREEAASEALERLNSTDINLHGEAPSTRERIILIHRDNPELSPAKIAQMLIATAPEVTATFARDVIYQVDRDKQATTTTKPKRGRKKKDESSNGTGRDSDSEVLVGNGSDDDTPSGGNGEENPSAGGTPARSG